jgi:glycine cleavage system H lipoate-binding protein
MHDEIFGTLIGLYNTSFCKLLKINNMIRFIKIKFNKGIMKTLHSLLLICVFLFVSHVSFSSGTGEGGNQITGTGTANVTTTSELEEFARSLSLGYNSATGKDISVKTTGEISHQQGIIILPKDQLMKFQDDLQWKILIGHEIIVPVINAGHPLYKELTSTGMTAGDFEQILSVNKWPEGLNGSASVPVQIYIPENEPILSKVTQFSGVKTMVASRLASSTDVVNAVQNDVNAIGFCRLADIVSGGENLFADRIRIIPVDKNQNGKLDGFEDFYSTPAEFTRGVWIGKYSRKLCSDVYAASVTIPENEETLAFLEWILNDGQQQVASLGFVNLLTREKTAGMLALRNPGSEPSSAQPLPALTNGWKAVIAAGLFVLLFLIAAFTRKKKQAQVDSDDITIAPAMNVNLIKAPAGLLYDKTHTWVFMEKDGMVRIGINDFLQHITGSLSQIKMKSPGEQVRKGEKMVSVIRDGKHLDLYSPVTGVIRKQNGSVLSNPSQVNTDPYDNGWLYQVEPLNWARETRFMIMADKFREWLDDEFTRLKDFMATSASSNRVVYDHIVLQDGGELTDNVLADMAPEVWEDFQTQFIDVSK